MLWETELFVRILMGPPQPSLISSIQRVSMNDLMRCHVWGCFSRCPLSNPKSPRLPRRLILPSNSQSRTEGEGGRGERRSVGWMAQAQGWPPESKGKQLEPTNLRGREKNAAGGLHEGFQFLPEQEGGWVTRKMRATVSFVPNDACCLVTKRVKLG